MLNVFDVFKIILGIIISIFVLFILLRFAGSYMQIGESSRQVSLMVNFKKTLENVYTTGVSDDFEFAGTEVITNYAPPFLMTTFSSSVDMEPIPLLLVPGKKLSVYRNEYDVGWWKFYFIEALPDTKILFVPKGDADKTMPVIRSVAFMLPSTENTATKTNFYVGCDDDATGHYDMRERYKFLEEKIYLLMTKMESGYEPTLCDEEYFKKKNYSVITISEKLEEVDFLVKPVENGMGYVYIKGKDGYEEYVYKNGFDVVALLLGGKGMYEYANEKFFREMDVAISLSVNEAGILMTNPSMNKRCGNQLNEFITVLSSIKENTPKIRGQNPKQEDVAEFISLMDQSAEKYRELDSLGCG